MFGADRVLAVLGDGKTVSASALKRAIAGRENTLRTFDLPSAQADIAGLALILARRPDTKAEEKDRLTQLAEDRFLAALAGAPAQPFAWLQAADLWFDRRGGDATFNRLLAMSHRTAPNERRLIVPRIGLAFRARRFLTDENRKRAVNDVKAMTRYQTQDVAQFAREKFALGWVSENLKGDKDLYNKFIAVYLRLPPR